MIRLFCKSMQITKYTYMV